MATSRTPSHQLLRTGLIANAIFSLATGILLVVAPNAVGGWLGVDIDGWLRLLGAALVGHAAILAIAARQREPRVLGKLNLIAIAPYPVLMILLVATGLIDRPLGRALVLADGAVVAALAAIHAKALLGPQPHLERHPT